MYPAENEPYTIFMRGMAPLADNVSNSGELTTNTSLITFDIMQLSSYDHVILTDLNNGQLVTTQQLSEQLQLNRITFSNLQGVLRTGHLYRVSVTSPEFREVPVFYTLVAQ